MFYLLSVLYRQKTNRSRALQQHQIQLGRALEEKLFSRKANSYSFPR